MDDDLKKLQEAVLELGGHVQDLQHEQNTATRDLRSFQESNATAMKALEANTTASLTNLEARSINQERTMAEMGGTIASMGQILTNMLAERNRVDALEEDMADVKTRLERLEKKAS